ncbi:MAG: pyrimidine-nucleoside phosphorylase, partial [Spirochaetota bacterium]
MRAVDIIQKKRDNHQLDTGEIEYLLNAYNAGDVPDYQMAAFCMAVFFTGMTDAELAVFTECMKESGDTISFDGVHRFLIDKHSTGGVGDKTTLALAPILAAFNIGTAKLSGRGLGHTGGTIDKFESIPGFAFPDNRSDLVELVNRTGIGIMGYSDTIV